MPDDLQQKASQIITNDDFLYWLKSRYGIDLNEEIVLNKIQKDELVKYIGYMFEYLHLNNGLDWNTLFKLFFTQNQGYFKRIFLNNLISYVNYGYVVKD